MAEPGGLVADKAGGGGGRAESGPQRACASVQVCLCISVSVFQRGHTGKLGSDRCKKSDCEWGEDREAYRQKGEGVLTYHLGSFKIM